MMVGSEFQALGPEYEMEGRRLVFNAQSARTVILERQSSRMHSA